MRESNERACERIELGPGGELRIRIDGADRVVELRGVTFVDELMPSIAEVIARLRERATPMRCTLPPDEHTSVPAATVRYLAWRDKSGDVWQDLAAALLDQGLARVGAGDFPERQEYLSREDKARDARRGIWAR